MQAIIDASAAVYELAGTKRAASTALPYESSWTTELQQPTPQHNSTCNQACLCKRQRTSNQDSSIKTENPSAASARNPLSIICHGFQSLEKAREIRKNYEPSNQRDTTPNMITEAATSFARAQDNNWGILHTAPTSDERLKELGNHITRAEDMKKATKDSLMVSQRETPADQQEQPSDCAPSHAEELDTLAGGGIEAVNCSETGRGAVGPQEQILRHDSKGHGRIHNFYTQASILAPTGIVRLERVKVDERSSFNLLPRSIAADLNLSLYPGKMLTIMVAQHLVETYHYSRFTIRVAGIDRMINAGVISGLQIVLLGREWMQSVNLMAGLGNHSYYIPVPLAIEAAKAEFSDIGDTGGQVQENEQVKVTTSDEIGEEYNDEESGNVDRADDGSSDGEIPLGNECLSDVDTLSGGGLSSRELSSDGQNSSEGDPAADGLLLGHESLSSDEISSGEELNLDEDDLVSTDEDEEEDEIYGGGVDYEDDEVYGNEEYYETYEGKDSEGCGCEGCECEGRECEGCECEGCEGCECEGCDCVECDSNLQGMEQHKHLEHFTEAHDIIKLEPEPKHDESVGCQAFDMSCQQAEHKGELVSTTSVS